jgi:hypothetical protein
VGGSLKKSQASQSWPALFHFRPLTKASFLLDLSLHAELDYAAPDSYRGAVIQSGGGLKQNPDFCQWQKFGFFIPCGASKQASAPAGMKKPRRLSPSGFASSG